MEYSLGKNFMMNNIEYVISNVNVKKERYSATPSMDEQKFYPNKNEVFLIDSNGFIVTYINKGAGFFTFKPVVR
jgi:hypothetical protein